MLADNSTELGSTVFDNNDIECYLTRIVPEGFLVQEKETEVIRFVKTAYTESPCESRIKKSISEANKKLDSLRTELSTLTSKKDELEKQYNEIYSRAKVIKSLQKVFDFLDKKITHFVYTSYCKIAIVPFDEFMKSQYTPYDKNKLKLLCLYGDSNGDMQWKINEYRDGSGSWSDCIPCSSFEEAAKIVEEICLKEFEDIRKSQDITNSMNAAIESAKKIGLKIPDDVASMIKERKKANLIQRKESAIKDVEKINSQILELEKQDV